MYLETANTIIRKFTKDDSDDLYEYLSLDETYRFEPGEPIIREMAIQMTAERAEGDEFFAVELKTNKKMIGHFYLGRINPDYINTVELGYIFNPKYQGKGYVTESGKALIKYYFDVLNVHKIIANCNPENIKSWKLLERLGFEREGLLKKNIYFKMEKDKPIWLDTYVYGLLNG